MLNGKDLDPQNKQHWPGVVKMFSIHKVSDALKQRIDAGELHLKATYAIILIFSAYLDSWLRDRDEEVPDATAHHMMSGHMTAMPGMLSPEQMTQLKAATGDEFYRLWLEFMIQHHQGAITMVGELLSSEGGAQETDIFKFADAVEEDQSMEIQRMQSMLARLR